MPTNKIIDEILDILREDHSAMIPRPATKEDIAECQQDLDEMALEQIPKDYIKFLKKSDGFAWNGIVFYGTHLVRKADNPTGFLLMDFVSVNCDFNDNYELDEKVLLGCEDDGYYTYNIETKKYEVSDEDPSEALEEYDTFAELFYETVGGRLGLHTPDEYEHEEGKYDGEV